MAMLSSAGIHGGMVPELTAPVIIAAWLCTEL
jgi:hypothetical protein